MVLLTPHFNIDDFYDKVANKTKFNARRPVVRTLVVIEPYIWNLYEGFKRCF